MRPEYLKTERAIPNGFLSVIKPQGLTTNSLLYYLKRSIPGIKAGQTGTLDPIATGVIVIGLGEATKVIPYLNESKKVYIAQLRFGVVSDTYDLDGTVKKICGDLPSKELLEEVLLSFIGEIKQTPPAHSAVKHKGKPTYHYARKGIHVPIKTRQVNVNECSLLWFSNDGSKAALRIVCARGTYVRSIVHDIGKLLKCGALMSKLARIQSGQFCLGESLSLSELKNCVGNDALDSRMISIDDAELSVKNVVLQDKQIESLAHGLCVEVQLKDLPRGIMSVPSADGMQNDIRIAVRNKKGELRLFASLEVASNDIVKILPRRVIVRSKGIQSAN